MKKIYLIEAVLLLLCLFDMPYGFYQLVRFVSMCVFAFLAFEEYAQNKKELAFVFGSLALLFQPFIKIVLGRIVWNIVDIVIAVFMIVLYIIHNSRNKQANNHSLFLALLMSILTFISCGSLIDDIECMDVDGVHSVANISLFKGFAEKNTIKQTIGGLYTC